MPNEQTSVPLFAASEILTAANMNISAGTGVPVFSGTATRNAAFGGAGEKLLDEGQLCYLSDTNVVQYYNGTIWVPLGQSQGLTYLSVTTTAVTTLSLPASTFTTTYRNYRVFLKADDSAARTCFLRFRSGGVDSAVASYQYASLGYTTAGAASNVSGVAQTSIPIGTSNIPLQLVMDVMAPQATAKTVVAGTSVSGNGVGDTTTNLGGAFNSTTSFDSLTFTFSVATNATALVYGYNLG